MRACAWYAAERLKTTPSPDHPTQAPTLPGDMLGGFSCAELAPLYLSMSATLHHVTAEWWWAHQTSGPSSWITDEALKVNFVIGVQGRVAGMRYQAEPALDQLAFFENILEE